MKTFALPELSRLKLTKATPRKETHGKELVQAISLRVEWWPTDNAAVNLLHDNLQDLLWWVPPEAAAQAELEAVPAVKEGGSVVIRWSVASNVKVSRQAGQKDV
jgi:hypothetical protein